jgi:hypothetical protein
MGRNNIRLAYLNFGPQKVSFCYIFSQTSSRRTKCEIKKLEKDQNAPPHMGFTAKEQNFEKKRNKRNKKLKTSKTKFTLKRKREIIKKRES